MNTLLIRLAAPLQSWGIQSHFEVRDTGREPSKSGVIGLLCAALGRQRDQPVEDLTSMRMGVRVDREGRLAMDYHTAQDVMKASGAGTKDTEVSRRYYLADAVFLVGLEGEDWSLLEGLQKALQAPHWPLFLGRKAFPPADPLWLADGLRRDERLEDALRAYPLLKVSRNPNTRLRLVIEDPVGELVRPDWPVSFAERRFATRRVRVEFFPAPVKLIETERRFHVPDTPNA